jgi:membrane protein
LVTAADAQQNLEPATRNPSNEGGRPFPVAHGKSHAELRIPNSRSPAADGSGQQNVHGRPTALGLVASSTLGFRVRVQVMSRRQQKSALAPRIFGKLVDIRRAVVHASLDIEHNHTLQMAAALAYYSVLALFPALITLSAVVAFLPVPDLFHQALSLMERFVPGDTMGLVRRVLADVISPNKGKFLSFGILGALWVLSSGFAAAIEALNLAYDVEEDRPFWKTRSLAIGLAFVIGALLLVALFAMIVGPRFGVWLTARIHLFSLFALLWPYMQWTIAVGFTILAVELLYFWGPNVKQRFLATLPGAILAVGCWIGLSYLLGIYFRHFAHFNRTYGTLGAAVALMVWLYWTGFAMLAGAELNAELAKVSSAGRVTKRQAPGTTTETRLAA